MSVLHTLKKALPFFTLTVIFNCTFTLINAQKLKPLAQLVKDAKVSRNFAAVKPFSPTIAVRGGNDVNQYSQFVKEETLVNVSERSFEDLYLNTSGAMTLTVPFKNQLLELELVEQNHLSEDFQVKTSASDNKPIAVSRGKFYRGIVKNDNESAVAISIFEGEMVGHIASSTLGNIVIAPTPEKNDGNNYLIYADRDMVIKNEFQCETAEANPQHSKNIELSTRGVESVNGVKIVRVYYECDYDLYLNKGSDVSKVVNFVSGAFNNVATIYMNEGINVVMSEVFVWTSASPYSRSSSSQALSSFAVARSGVNADLGQLLTYGGNAKGGLAFVGTLCYKSFKFSYANILDTYETFPTYSWTVMVMSHELGHNMGSQHTQWCGWPNGPIDNCVRQEGTCNPGPDPVGGGTIMSYCMSNQYGVNFSKGFGPLPGSVIRTYVSAANCLTTPVVCNAPTTPIVSNVGLDKAQVSWSPAENAVSYKIEYKTASENAWKSVLSTQNAVNLTNLAIYDSFRVRIYSVCSNGLSSVSPEQGFRTLNNLVCGEQQSPSVSNITTTSAKFSWLPVVGATRYKMEYRTDNMTTWKNAFTSETTYSLNNLSASKNFEVRVTATCTDVTGLSSPITSFSTLGETTVIGEKNNKKCNPTVITAVDNVSTDDALVSWKPSLGATSYKLEYKKVDEIDWQSTTAATNTVSINNLVASTPYSVRVSAVCTAMTGRPSAEVTFSTKEASPECVITEEPIVETIKGNTATLSWQGMSEATRYVLEYKTANSSVWSSIIVDNTHFMLTKLDNNQTYHARVVPVCDGHKGTSSAISAFTIGSKGLETEGVAHTIQYKIAPNPTKGLLNVIVESSVVGEAHISVIDGTGRVVKSLYTMPIQVGLQNSEIDLSNFNNGIYFIHIANKNEVVVKKALLMKD